MKEGQLAPDLPCTRQNVLQHQKPPNKNTQVPYRAGVALTAVLANALAPLDAKHGPGVTSHLALTSWDLLPIRGALRILTNLFSALWHLVAPQQHGAHSGMGSLLSATLAQQLADSGVLQQVPRLLSTVAGLLEKLSADTSISQPASTDQHSIDRKASGKNPRTRDATGSAACDSIVGAPLFHPLLLTALEVQSSFTVLRSCSSATSSPTSTFRSSLRACAGPAMHLGLLVYQRIQQHADSLSMGQRTQQALNADELSHVSYCSWSSLATAVAEVHTNSLQSALAKPVHTMQAVSISLTYAVYSMLLLQGWGVMQTAAPGRGGSRAASAASSGGTTSSKSSSQVLSTAQLAALSDPNKAWEFACSQHKHLPASHEKLLQLAGSSSRTVLWVAALGMGFHVGRRADVRKTEFSLQCALRGILHSYPQILKHCWQADAGGNGGTRDCQLQLLLCPHCPVVPGSTPGSRQRVHAALCCQHNAGSVN